MSFIPLPLIPKAIEHAANNVARLKPGRETAFRVALQQRDFVAALNYCRKRVVDDLYDGIMIDAAPPQMIGLSPRYEFFSWLTDFLTDDEYFPLTGHVWVEVDDKRVPPAVAEPLFGPVDRDKFKRRSIMNVAEQARFDSLPDQFQVYRGCTRDTVENCCWSMDRQIAQVFAEDYAAEIEDLLCTEDQTPAVFEATCKKADVLAVFTRWGEEEIVVNPARLANKREIWHRD